MIKWVARLAILTVVLGLIGTILIITRMPKKQERKEIRKDEKVSQIHQFNADTAEIKSAPKQAEKPVLTERRPPGISKEEQAVEKEKVLPAEKIAKPPENKVAVQKPPKKEVKNEPREKTFTEAELQHLIARINAKKNENGIYTNCVQIFTTEQNKHPRIRSQIENFLRSHRFSIAGRETISKKVKGIQITPAGGCIRITIGAL